MKYIGVDTGTKLLGWAIVDEQGGCISSGWVDLETTLSRKASGWDSLEIRLKSLSDWAEWFFLDMYGNPVTRDALVGIEHPWVGKSKQTSLTLGMAWGIIAQAAMQCGFRIVKIEPTQAKKALTGSGGVGKKAMHEAACRMGARCEGKGRFDEADALGVALAARLLAIEQGWDTL